MSLPLCNSKPLLDDVCCVQNVASPACATCQCLPFCSLKSVLLNDVCCIQKVPSPACETCRCPASSSPTPTPTPTPSTSPTPPTPPTPTPVSSPTPTPIGNTAPTPLISPTTSNSLGDASLTSGIGLYVLIGAGALVLLLLVCALCWNLQRRGQKARDKTLQMTKTPIPDRANVRKGSIAHQMQLMEKEAEMRRSLKAHSAPEPLSRPASINIGTRPSAPSLYTATQQVFEDTYDEYDDRVNGPNSSMPYGIPQHSLPYGQNSLPYGQNSLPSRQSSLPYGSPQPTMPQAPPSFSFTREESSVPGMYMSGGVAMFGKSLPPPPPLHLPPPPSRMPLYLQGPPGDMTMAPLSDIERNMMMQNVQQLQQGGLL